MTEVGRLEGKRALVTGGGRGIGTAIARRLAADGAAVAINYVSDARSADALVGELTAAGHRAAAFRAADPEQTHDLVAGVVAEFGGVDLLGSNAGVDDQPIPRIAFCEGSPNRAGWSAEGDSVGRPLRGSSDSGSQ